MTKVYHISDWHTLHDRFVNQLDFEIAHQELEAPDLLLVTGDMIANFNGRKGREAGLDDEPQRSHWLRMVDYIDHVWPGVDILAVRGNHDYCAYGVKGKVKAFDLLVSPDIAEQVGNIKVAGFRGVSYWFGGWNDEFREEAFEALCAQVPADTDILITHEPPNGIMDDTRDVRCYICGKAISNSKGVCSIQHVWDNPNAPRFNVVPRNIGSPAIRKLVDEHPKLKLHAFGHIHEQGGSVEVRGDVICSNAAGTLNVIDLEAIERIGAGATMGLNKIPQEKPNTWEND